MTTNRPRRRAAALTVTAALLAGAVAAGAALWWPDAPAAAEPALDPVTARVERATLTSELRLTGTLTFGDPVPLPAIDAAITVLPSAGAVVGPGEQVLEADGAPVVLLTGSRPFWRDLCVDSDDGEDVLQLEENLAALGHLTARAPGRRFDWRTRQAVRDWQHSLGVPQTGELTAASVVVTDAPSLRIHQVTARLGEAGVSAATVTGTELHVVVTLSESQARDLVAGTPVTVALPDGAALTAELTEVDPGGLPDGDDGSPTAPTATIRLADEVLPEGARPGAATVTVHDGADRPATLVVPVSALLATAQGGFAVEVWDGVATRRVDVEIGLVADARVQVVGGDLVEGALVVLAR